MLSDAALGPDTFTEDYPHLEGTNGARPRASVDAGADLGASKFEFSSSIPDWAFDFPPSDQRKGIDRGAAAELIDGFLRRLLSQEASLRRLFGRIAAVFVEWKLYERLGFRSLGDFCRERLGVSASEVRSAAKVERALRHLPRLARAFERGEVGWSQARLLAAVCTPENESRWVERARQLTVRELLSEIERLGADADRGSSAPTADARPAPDAGSGDGPSRREAVEEVRGRLEGEPAVRFSLRCPRRLLPLWRQTVERARWLTGSDGPIWQAAEAIAAEGASSLEPGKGRGLEEPVTAGAVLSAEDPPPGEERPPSRTEAFPLVDWGEVLEAAPIDLERFCAGLAPLGPWGLEEKLREVSRALRRLDWQTGRLLHVLFRLGLHRLLGFSTREEYVRERLGMSARRARMLVALDRRGFDYPELASARREGRLTSLRALALLPVLDEKNAAAWIERAQEVTLRRLCDEVDFALDRHDASAAQGFRPFPPPHGLRLEAAGGEASPEARERQMCAGDPSGSATGLGDRPGPDSCGRQMCAPDSRERQTCPPRSVAFCDGEIRFVGPASVVGFFRSVVLAYKPDGEPLWRGLEALLLRVRAQWDSLPHSRDPVFRRDRYRCAVPGCSARANLHDHHIRFRSLGGDNSPGNRTPTCAWHHLRGLHRGIVRAAGRAPDGIVWQLGTRSLSRSRALSTLLGDRYLDGFPH